MDWRKGFPGDWWRERERYEYESYESVAGEISSHFGEATQALEDRGASRLEWSYSQRARPGAGIEEGVGIDGFTLQ